MREVKQLERILGQEYGIIPNQLNNTWWNRYTEHIKEKNFNEKIILKGFLHKCVDEGIADYLAIQSQKLKAQEEKRKLSEVYCYERERLLSGNPKERQMINGVTPINFPLNFETAKKIKLDSFTLMVGYSAIKSASGIKRIIFCSYLEELFENLPYFFGYYLVRTRLKNKQEGIGKEVDKLLMNPPKSIEEFSNEVLSGFRE